jgi:hypothetical protein
MSAYLELGLNVPGDESQCLHASAEVRDLLVLPGTDDLVEARHGELGHCADELGGQRHIRDPAQQRVPSGASKPEPLFPGAGRGRGEYMTLYDASPVPWGH